MDSYRQSVDRHDADTTFSAIDYFFCYRLCIPCSSDGVFTRFGLFRQAPASMIASPILFGFPSDFQTFRAQRLFAAVGSSITDVRFFVPSTKTAATVSAFGLVFVDVEVADISGLAFDDVAVMDDFLDAEPQQVPEPPILVLLTLG